jgi:hypothetical protein
MSKMTLRGEILPWQALTRGTQLYKYLWRRDDEHYFNRYHWKVTEVYLVLSLVMPSMSDINGSEDLELFIVMNLSFSQTKHSIWSYSLS